MCSILLSSESRHQNVFWKKISYSIFGIEAIHPDQMKWNLCAFFFFYVSQTINLLRRVSSLFLYFYLPLCFRSFSRKKETRSKVSVFFFLQKKRMTIVIDSHLLLLLLRFFVYPVDLTNVSSISDRPGHN